MEKAIVGITLGDASGIGPEIVAKLCVKGYFTQYFRPIMIGDVRVFEDGLRIIGAEYPHYVIKDVDEADWSKGQPVLDLGDQDPALVTMGKTSAYCGIGAEERGQAQAIAENLYEMSALKTPIVSVFIGEGGSGGALGLAVADEVWMTENAVYSVISPEGCASILWKDPARVADAAECLKLTASDLYSLGVIDRILLETGGESVVFSTLKVLLARKLRALCAVDPAELTEKRYDRFRAFGNFLTL